MINYTVRSKLFKTFIQLYNKTIINPSCKIARQNGRLGMADMRWIYGGHTVDIRQICGGYIVDIRPMVGRYLTVHPPTRRRSADMRRTCGGRTADMRRIYGRYTPVRLADNGHMPI